jgi:hypothetical protein
MWRPKGKIDTIHNAVTLDNVYGYPSIHDGVIFAYIYMGHYLCLL